MSWSASKASAAESDRVSCSYEESDDVHCSATAIGNRRRKLRGRQPRNSGGLCVEFCVCHGGSFGSWGKVCVVWQVLGEQGESVRCSQYGSRERQLYRTSYVCAASNHEVTFRWRMACWVVVVDGNARLHACRIASLATARQGEPHFHRVTGVWICSKWRCVDLA